MKEIKFRGKRIDNGEWVQGYLFKIWEQTYILWGTTNGIPNMIEVYPETVGQYTGLKDKNGKEIYESDIIRYDNERYEVYWSEDWAMYTVRGCQVQALMRYASNGEVIGNIYETLSEVTP